MAKINELQKKRKDILLDMNKKELIVLFNEINKKAIDSIASVKNGFNWNVEEINKANEELVELENILSEKYSNIHGLTASTRFNLLLERYIENTEEAKVLFFYNYFEKNLKNRVRSYDDSRKSIITAYNNVGSLSYRGYL